MAAVELNHTGGEYAKAECGVRSGKMAFVEANCLNILHRLFTRQICRARPNTHIHQARKLYENIVPSHTVYDVECPDQSFRKFTNDGQFLICFSRNHQDLVVYRHKWLNFCVGGEASDQLLDLPPKSRNFDSYFSLLYTIPLASGTEVICKDFFLSTENGLYGIFATSTVPDNPNSATDGAVPGVPSTEKTTIFLVSLAEGRITDQRAFHDDFIHLAHNMGVFLYDDLLAILSIRFQCIRIFQIRETGKFVDVRTIGAHCREDDELILNSQAQEEESYHKQQACLRKARGLPSPVDLSFSREEPNAKGNHWLPLWNIKHGQLTKRDQRNRRNSTRFPLTHDPVSSGQPENDDSSVNRVYDSIGGAELDLQYDNYFRGLFATLEDSTVSQINGGSASDVGRSSSIVEGRINTISQERGNAVPRQAIMGNGQYGGGGEHWTGDVQQPSLRNGQFAGERASTLQASVSSGQMTGGTSYAPLDFMHDNLHAGRNLDASTSGSGGHYSSFGPSRYGRSYTSTSGSSLDRYTSGRGSPSLRYTSTTITSSDSGSHSGSSRRDVSVSGGSRSYGSGRAGNGSVSVQSERGNLVEYVVSSHVHPGDANVQQVCPEEPSIPSSSHQGTNEQTTFGRGLRENGQIIPSNTRTNTGNVGSIEYRWPSRTADEPNSTDDTLPSRFGDRSTSVSDMAVSQAGAARAALVSVRETANGNRGQGVTDSTQIPARPAREGENTLSGGVQRNLPTGDAVVNNEHGGQMLRGIKQRLLSFIFQGVWNDDVSPILKAQRLKRFYYHFQHYIDLVMWKVQFLDRYHLLIKFGSVDGVLQRNSDTSHQTSFLAIFNLQTTEMLGFYQNSSEELFLSFEQFCDHFRVAPRYPQYMNFISSYSNNIHARDQLRKQRVASSSGKTGTYSQVVKRTLAWVPSNSQCQSPSAYFDQSLFHYDEKLISAMDRHKPCMEHPIKFISRRRPNSLKFKINPGPELSANDARSKRVASFIFHPVFPFAISIQQSFMQPPIVNFHFRK